MENVITESLRNEISNMGKINLQYMDLFTLSAHLDKLKELQNALQIQCDKEVR